MNGTPLNGTANPIATKLNGVKLNGAKVNGVPLQGAARINGAALKLNRLGLKLNGRDVVEVGVELPGAVCATS